MSKDRYVTCIGCAYAMTWLEHECLRVAVGCTNCGADNQFGPGVYVPDFTGYSIQEVLQQRARKRPLNAVIHQHRSHPAE